MMIICEPKSAQFLETANELGLTPAACVSEALSLFVQMAEAVNQGAKIELRYDDGQNFEIPLLAREHNASPA